MPSRTPGPSRYLPTHAPVDVQAPHLQLDVVRRQQMTMFRQGSHSDVIHGMQCARPIKVFLYGWNVLIIVLGLGLLCMGLYFLYYQENGRMVPPLAYNLATYTGLALALISVLGLVGLQQQRRCTTHGKRNYALAFFILFSVVGASIIIAGGVIALTLRTIADAADANDFTQDRVRYFEAAVIEMLKKYVQEDAGGWRGLQNSMYCCGYYSAAALKAASTAEWESGVLEMVGKINAVAGQFCTISSHKGNCSVTDGYPCPATGRPWCRSEVFASIVGNYQLLGIYAIVIGGCQLLSAAFALFTLLCDVRMLHHVRSPTFAMIRKALAPLRRAPSKK